MRNILSHTINCLLLLSYNINVRIVVSLPGTQPTQGILPLGYCTVLYYLKPCGTYDVVAVQYYQKP